MNNTRWARQNVEFICDTRKRMVNISKHRIDPVDASAAFFDPFLLSDFDAEHSASEDRYGIIGKMDNGKLIHVFYTFRGESVRIISARKVTPKEELAYEGSPSKKGAVVKNKAYQAQT